MTSFAKSRVVQRDKVGERYLALVLKMEANSSRACALSRIHR